MAKDLELVNGKIAVYEGEDYWCQARYTIGTTPVVMGMAGYIQSVTGMRHNVS